MVKIVYQKHEIDVSYASLTLAQVAKAMWSSFTKLSTIKQQVLVDFAVDTTYEDDVKEHHGLIMCDPFSSPIIITSGYGGFDFGACQFAEIEDEFYNGSEWQNKYPGLTINEAILCRALESQILDEWKDENGLLWCEVKGCIEEYIKTLPVSDIEVINNK